jgi:sugar O-acyltransferase (sialic acid O-acetyltransferase NeuD family)
VYGGGGHGKSIIDLIRALGTYEIAGIVDDGISKGSHVMGIRVLGGAEVLDEVFERGVVQAVNAVGGVGDVDLRIRIFHRLLAAGFTCPALVHPSATVEPSAKLGEGVQVLPHAYVGSEAELGFGVLLNNGAIVSHDCRLGDYASLAPGALLAGGVVIGDGAQLGMGVTVNLKLSIGRRAQIGNGAVIKGDVLEESVVRAGQIWPPRG